MNPVRIQKYLADIGVTSRRAAEEMILEGRITVNGKMIARVPCFVDPEVDEIRVDGEIVRKKHGRHKSFLVSKPKGMVCESSLAEGRPRVAEILPPVRGPLHLIAPLDMESTGLVIFTNDGELVAALTHARTAPPRTYHVEIEGRLGEEEVSYFRGGMFLDEKRAAGPISLSMLGKGTERTMMEIVIHETVHRQLRRMLAAVGARVRRMKRIAIGPVTDRGLKIGHWREMTPQEVEMLKHPRQQGARQEDEHGRRQDRQQGSRPRRGRPGDRQQGRRRER